MPNAILSKLNIAVMWYDKSEAKSQIDGGQPEEAQISEVKEFCRVIDHYNI